MNAKLATTTPDALVLRAADLVQRSGTAARVWYLATSALTGAVLSMAVAWPGAHTPDQRTALPQSPIAAAPPAPKPSVAVQPAAAVQPAGAVGGAAVLEAVRAVGAASEVLVLARGQSANLSPLSAGLAPPAPAGARTVVSSVAAIAPAAATTTISATGSSVVREAGSGGQPAAATALGSLSVDTRQPPAAQGPNRISVPGGPPAQPPPTAQASAGSVSVSTGGANRISVPSAPPPP